MLKARSRNATWFHSSSPCSREILLDRQHFRDTPDTSSRRLTLHLEVDDGAPHKAPAAPPAGQPPLNPHQLEFYLTPIALLRDFPHLGALLAFWFWISLKTKRDIIIWQYGSTNTGPYSYDDFVMANLPPGVDPNYHFRSRVELRQCFPFLSWDESLHCWHRNYTYGRVIQHMVRFEYALAHITTAANHVGLTLLPPRPVPPDFTPIYHPVLDRWGWLGFGLKITAMFLVVGLAELLFAGVEFLDVAAGALFFLLRIGMWGLVGMFLIRMIRSR